ncbi:preprotein translocase subunit SecA [Candidatus Peregrinibacteria bacterium]|nr:preprotein translocase subunit SecA [Candidatus Peregrinibacteria bacterium]
MIRALINKLLGDNNAKELKKITPLVAKINKFHEEYKENLKDQNDILQKTSEFKERLKNGESLDDLLPEAFALVKTAATHLLGKSWDVRGKQTVWDMVPYDVQLIGGIVLHKGNISEMKTGEGKTLVCTMPVYLNALTEKGVFVVTVNDYLAQRDSEWMGGLYNYLGLSIGVIIHGQTHEQKKAAYSCDITYGTNNEYGFDYLRDNMATNKEEIVQRNLHYAIVDEVDSILIDESRTPLIISAPAQESTSKYQQYARLIPQLAENSHYNLDEKTKNATLSEEGIAKMEQLLGLENIYTEAGFTEVHHIEQALRAQACYKKDVDYIVKDDQVVIIDEFTGRLMPGRRFGHGLHQAIEAKEKVEIKRESKTLATITFQNYFRLFEKLAGMTGTALTEAEEFYQIYGLDTIVIPTNKPVTRLDKSDLVYKNTEGKFSAVVEKIKSLHEKGQPVLVGTISVEKSEMLSQLLKIKGVPHNVLNAKNHEKEAEIVSDAGKKGSVTIATNMAGRGTDIKLGEGVTQVGGLFVLGTERHESRRIDNQLRGRSGRQGDPGESQFFVSMEDDLMRIFGGDRIKSVMNMLKVPDDMPIENAIISRSIESAQKKVEGHNFDIRKHLVEYDDVMNIHREIIYKRRRDVLTSSNIREEIIAMIEDTAEAIVINHTEAREEKEWNYQEIYESLIAIYRDDQDPLTIEQIKSFKDQKLLIEKAKKYLTTSYEKREAIFTDPSTMRDIERAVFLRSNDVIWMDHIDALSQLRQSVAFSGYAQKDPLTEYKSQGYDMFQEMMAMIRNNTVQTLFKIDLEKVVPEQMLRKSEVKKMATNEGQIEANLSAGSGRKSEKPAKTVTRNGVTYTTLSSTPSKTGSTTCNSGRNDPCPCGSGKKYKKCCGRNFSQ